MMKGIKIGNKKITPSTAKMAILSVLCLKNKLKNDIITSMFSYYHHKVNKKEKIYQPQAYAHDWYSRLF